MFSARPLTILVVVVCSAAHVAAAADVGSFTAALETIRTNDLKNHAQVLASDTFEGREAGSAGGRAAGAYIVAQLRKWRIQPGGEDGDFFQYFGNDYRNILALLPGSDPKLKDEFLLVTAHYDHVGLGNSRNSRGPIGQIHNGADDNASGISGVLELVEALATLEPAPKRSILFVFWDGEEKGLLGSEHWVRYPTIPLDRIRLLFNADMIGRLSGKSLEIYGSRTAPGLRRLICEGNDESGPELEFVWLTKRDSDHYPFYERRIPFLMPHTRKHDDYHRPSDDVEKLDFEGMRTVSQFIFRAIDTAADRPVLPSFREPVFREDPNGRNVLETPATPWPSRLGVSWDNELAARNILKLTAVDPDSTAQAAGLSVGDQVLEFDGHKIQTADEFRARVLAAKNPAEIVVQRAGDPKPRRLKVQLSGDALRFGFSWRVDDAEPNSVILDRVARGSPAQQAGLRVGDRIYAIGGQPFASEPEFRERLQHLGDGEKILVERRGRMRTVELHPAIDTNPPTVGSTAPQRQPIRPN